ncbi:MAG: nitrilase-related carbon-nitrogen hydrolase [Actinomycetota bacterium]
MGVGLVQLLTDPRHPDRSRSASLEGATEAFERGANIVVLPELCVPGYTTDPELLEAGTETVDGPTVRDWARLAHEHDGFICGGFAERDGSQRYNSAVVVGGDGVLLHYRKLHLFEDENGVFVPGDRGLSVLALPWGTVGVCICYDLRFVEVLRILSLQGADLVCVPTAWLPGFDRDAWDERGMAPQAHVAAVQANLDQVFVACASQAGTMGNRTFLGSSIVASPRGAILEGPLPTAEGRVTVTRVDLEEVHRAQRRGEQIAPREDRRRDVYGLVVEGDEL